MLRYLVEFLGTFIFLSVILTKGEAIPIGITLAAMIFMGGNISGGNFNPAVSFSMMINNKMSGVDCAGYIGAQLAGAFCAVSFANLQNNN